MAETRKGRGQARGGVGRWQTSAEGLGKVDEQSKAKSNGQIGSIQEEKLNSIGFVWDEKEYNWKVWFDAVKSFKEKEGGGRDRRRQRTSERWCWQMANHDKLDEQTKRRAGTNWLFVKKLDWFFTIHSTSEEEDL